MNDKNKVLCAMPCNDRAIFMDEDGFLRERIGIVWKSDRAGNENPYFVDKEGFITEPSDVNIYPDPMIIANVGETLRPEALSCMVAQADNVYSIYADLEEMGVKIDRTHLPETLKVFFIGISKDSNCFVNIEAPDGACLFDGRYVGRFDLDNEDENYCSRDSDGELSMNPYGLLSNYLMAYSKLLGKKVNFEIYFQKYTSDTRDYEEKNLVVREDEKKCLGDFRKTIKETLEAAWKREQKDVTEKQREKELELQVASKYDKDPNLME